MSSADGHPKPIVGICMDMCPLSELQMREKNGLLHEFEITKVSEINMYRRLTNREKATDPDRPKADKRKTVKQFSRSSAGQKMQTPEELRPTPVLLKTTDYLFTKYQYINLYLLLTFPFGRVISRTDHPFHTVYDFVFDRLRAIRQDMAIQCLDNRECLTILEQCVRFHIYSEYHFEGKDFKLYDNHINEIHLRECLQSLLKRYETHSTSTHWPKMRPLFESVYLIYYLGTNEVFDRYRGLPKGLKEHHTIKQCFQLSVNVGVNRYYQALQTIVDLRPPILALLAATKIQSIHFSAIKIMSFAYNSPNTKFPIETLHKWLCPFETNEDKSLKYLKQLCISYGLTVGLDFVVFNKSHFNPSPKELPTQKWSLFEFLVQQLSRSSMLRGRTEYLFIEEKPKED